MKKRQSKIVKTFNEFKGTNSEILDSFYAKNISFQDPVTSVNGLDSLKKYYAHAYKNVQMIQFDFDEFFFDGGNVLATWTMQVKAKGLNSGKKFSLPGISKFKFDRQDLVTEHRDYFDLGAMVYERLPVQGTIISAIKKVLAAGGR